MQTMTKSETGFAAATRVRPADEPGTWHADIAPGWDIMGNANGGYLLAIAARALREATGAPDPISITAHYLAPGKRGPARVETEIVRRSRSFVTGTAQLSAADGPLVQVLGTFGTAEADPDSGPTRMAAGPPALPPVEDCLALRPTATFPPPFVGRVDLRLHPADAAFADGAPSGAARMRGWFRLPDGAGPDTLALLVAADAFPPAVFNTDLPIAWTPTLELTAHVRARPTTHWLRCEFTTSFVTGGRLESDGLIWDAADRLVCQVRQLALVPRA